MSGCERIMADIESLKQITDGRGTTRVGFTETYRKGSDCFRKSMEQAGLKVREDSIGNLYGLLEGEDKDAPVILSGSHLDTVINAGAYDGIAGAVCALEAARMIKDNGVKLRHSYEVIATNEEEGTGFRQSLLGSMFVTGDLTEDDTDKFRNVEGKTLKEVLPGFRAKDAVPALRSKDEVKAFLELHIEQGPVLETAGKDIGIVSSITAIAWMTVTITGFAGHAGTVPMPLRQDPMTGACRLIDTISAHTLENYANTAVLTVGRFGLEPGSSNTIPAKCVFTIDLRSEQMEIVQILIDYIRKTAAEVAEKFKLEIDVNLESLRDPISMDLGLRGLIRQSCDELGYSSHEMFSGAGHDAMIFAKQWPTAMIFIPCYRGISHSPDEYVEPEAIIKGAKVLYETILKVDKQ